MTGRAALGLRSLWAPWLIAAACLPASTGWAAATEPEPLHERIDRLIEQAALGPLADPVGDAEFLRRGWLDLAGMIPPAAEATAFTADASGDKRARLVERLLASPHCARHLAQTFDAWLTERTNGPQVKADQWRDYLRAAMAANKPFDELAREILAADGSPGPLRPAAKFYLDRMATPAVLTRDVGRMFFGIDVQCAECHDHPLISDYHQGDYYGIYAFLSRSSLFTDAKAKQQSLAEKADGEVNYKSVFTGFALDRVRPRVPEGPALDEPADSVGMYLTAPAKDVRSVPKFSRREALGYLAASGQSAAFNRNIANRLWAQLFGRGLVEPVDVQHSGNPPVNPPLLDLLTDEFVRSGYNIRQLLGELMLTRAYARSSEPPPPDRLHASAARERLPELESAARQCEEQAKTAAAAAESTNPPLIAAREELAKAQTGAATAAFDEARKAAAKLAADEAAARQTAANQQAAAAALAEAVAKTKLALEKLAGDKALPDLVKQLEARAQAAATAATAAEKSQAEFPPKLAAALAKVAAEHAALAPLEALRRKVGELEDQQAAARRAWAAAKTAQAHAAARLAEAQAILAYAELAQKAAASHAPADEQAAQAAWQGLVDRWTRSFAVRYPKPLSPEQFGWSVLQGLGQVGQATVGAEAEVKQSPPPGTDLNDAALRARLVEERMVSKLQGSANLFVAAFSSGPGQSAYVFQPSVGQALFMDNATALQTLVTNGGTPLMTAMLAEPAPERVAELAYLHLYTRIPSDEEREDIVAFLRGRDSDRAAALQELLWALIAATEFRFCR